MLGIRYCASVGYYYRKTVAIHVPNARTLVDLKEVFKKIKLPPCELQLGQSGNLEGSSFRLTGLENQKIAVRNNVKWTRQTVWTGKKIIVLTGDVETGDAEYLLEHLEKIGAEEVEPFFFYGESLWSPSCINGSKESEMRIRNSQSMRAKSGWETRRVRKKWCSTCAAASFCSQTTDTPKECHMRVAEHTLLRLVKNEKRVTRALSMLPEVDFLQEVTIDGRIYIGLGVDLYGSLFIARKDLKGVAGFNPPLYFQNKTFPWYQPGKGLHMYMRVREHHAKQLGFTLLEPGSRKVQTSAVASVGLLMALQGYITPGPMFPTETGLYAQKFSWTRRPRWKGVTGSTQSILNAVLSNYNKYSVLHIMRNIKEKGK